MGKATENLSFWYGQFSFSKGVEDYAKEIESNEALKEAISKRKLYQSEIDRVDLADYAFDDAEEFAQFLAQYAVKPKKQRAGVGRSKTMEIIEKTAPELFAAIKEFDAALKEKDSELYLSVVIRKKLNPKAKAETELPDEEAPITTDNNEVEDEVVFDED